MQGDREARKQGTPIAQDHWEPFWCVRARYSLWAPDASERVARDSFRRLNLARDSLGK